MAPEWSEEAERDIPFAVIIQLFVSNPREMSFWTQVEKHLKTWGHDVGGADEICKHWREVTWEQRFVEPKRRKVKAAASDPAAQKLPMDDMHCDCLLSDWTMHFVPREDSEDYWGDESSGSECGGSVSSAPGTTGLPIRTRLPTTSVANVDDILAAAEVEKLPWCEQDFERYWRRRPSPRL